MQPTDAHEIAAALAERIEDLAEQLVGDRPTFRGRDQIRFYPRGGLAVIIAGRERGLWCSHGDGGIGGDALDLVRHLRRCTMAEAITWARDYLGQPAAVRPQSRPAAAPALQSAASDKIELARQIWIEARDPEGTPVETYLESRLLRPRADAPMRFHPSCRRGVETLAAMVALMTDPITAEPCGIHRTFLRPDGTGKANGQAKMMLGNAGVIRLVRDDEVTLGLGICEGIETGLAIMQHTGWSPVWACGSAGAIAKFPILAGIEALTVFADLDDSGAGIDAAEKCARRWRDAGKSVAIAKPPRGKDWHDALVRRAAA